MSLRSTHSDGLTVDDVIRLLGSDEESRRAVTLLSKYWKKGRIPAAELDDETALLLDHFRLALPIRSVHDSLSWKMRLFSVSDMEIPFIIRFFFEDLNKGSASWKRAIVRYFRAIGETRPEEFTEIFEEMLRRNKRLIVCGGDIADISVKFGRDGGVVIAEMKGAGLISPIVGCGGFGKTKAPIYEINRFFAMLPETER